MDELVALYEKETGKKGETHVTALFQGSSRQIMFFTDEYVEWLEAQLTPQPVSKPPKEGQIVFAMISTGWIVAQYFKGEFYIDDGFTYGYRIEGVVKWLPIPPSDNSKEIPVAGTIRVHIANKKKHMEWDTSPVLEGGHSMSDGIKRFKELAKDYMNNPQILRDMLKDTQERCEELQAENAQLKIRIIELEKQLYERFDEQADMEAGQ